MSFKHLSTKRQIQQTDTFLSKLKGLDFAKWNLTVGLPVKAGRGQLPFPFSYQWTVFNSLMQEDGSPKDRHVAWLGSRGQGKTEFGIRFLCWLATRNDDLKGSEMMIITGARASLSYSIISRIKTLMQKANLEDSAMSYINLNGTKIEGYPADALSGRGKSFISAIFVDESSFWTPSETQNVLDMIQGYWPKFPSWTLLASSPSQSGDLMDQIFKQPEEQCAWHRLKLDWRYGENLIYTQADIERIRSTSSWKREMELTFSYAGGSFLPSQIERATKHEYSLDLVPNTSSIMGIDVGWGSSATSICICSLINGRIIVYFCDEFTQAVPEDMISLVLELQQKYNVAKTYCDAANPGFIRSLLLSMHKDPEYNAIIKRAHEAKIDPGLWLSVIPTNFGTLHKQLLSNVKMLLSDDLIAINPKWNKLVQSLHSAIDTENSLDKQRTIHSDALDSFRLSLQGFQIGGR